MYTLLHTRKSLYLVTLLPCLLYAHSLVADVLPEILVTVDAEALNAFDAPQTISVIDTHDSHYTSSTRLEDFADYVPGVFTGRNSAGTGNDVSIRGFSIGGRIYKDGLLDNQVRFLRDPATVERVEIIKGHESVLFGSGSPGGTVNYITKKPQSAPVNKIKVSVGSPELARVEHDIAGSLRADNSLLYRMITALQKSETGIKNVEDNRITLMPSLTWRNEKTKIDLSAEYSQRERPFDFDAVLRNDEPVYDISYVDPRNLSERHNRMVSATVAHALNKNWKVKLQSHHASVDRDERLVGFYYKRNEDDLVGYYRDVLHDYSQLSLKAEAQGRLSFGRLLAEPTFGVEKNQRDGYTDSARNTTAYTLDILNPQFDFPLPVGDELTENNYRIVFKDKAIYALNSLLIGEDWRIKTGLRKSWFDEYISKVDLFEVQSDSNALSTSLGVSWTPVDEVVAYVSRSTSYTPNSPDRKLNTFPPKKGVQFDLGLRYQPESSKWRASVSTYRITQSNLAVRDPDDRDLKILSGEQEVKGLELLASRVLGDNLKLSLGYSYMDGKITKDTRGAEGNTLNNIPRHSGSLKLSYQMPNAMGKKTKIDFGVVAAGSRQGDRANSFEVDGYTRVDMNLHYPLNKRTFLDVSVKNLLDKDYIAASYSQDTLVIGYPRRVMLTLQHDF